jgi:hypothetical protein
MYGKLYKISLKDYLFLHERNIDYFKKIEYEHLFDNDKFVKKLTSKPHNESTTNMINYCHNNKVEYNTEIYMSYCDKDELYKIVKNYAYLFQCINDKELCHKMIKEDINLFRYANSKLLDKEICLYVVTLHGNSLMYVPNNLIDIEICNAAVRQCGKSLAYVPNNFKTPRLCLSAIKQNINALSSTPNYAWTDEIFIEIAHYLNIPTDLSKNDILIQIAIEKPNLLNYIPYTIDESAYLIIFTQNSNIFYYIPESARTEEMYIYMINNYYHGLGGIPENKRTAKIYFEWYKKNIITINNIPHEFLDRNMCLHIVKYNGMELKNIPIKDKEICLEAVKKNKYALHYVPHELLTKQMLI